MKWLNSSFMCECGAQLQESPHKDLFSNEVFPDEGKSDAHCNDLHLKALSGIFYVLALPVAVTLGLLSVYFLSILQIVFKIMLCIGLLIFLLTLAPLFCWLSTERRNSFLRISISAIAGVLAVPVCVQGWLYLLNVINLVEQFSDYLPVGFGKR